MPFRKSCHMPFRKLIPPFTLTGKEGVKVGYKPFKTLKQYFLRPKDKITSHETWDAIYNINFAYYGQTGRAVNTRISEHKRAVGTFDPNSRSLCINMIITFSFFITFIDHIVISYINKCERLRYKYAHTHYTNKCLIILQITLKNSFYKKKS